MIEPAFRCDDLDDLRDSDPFALDVDIAASCDLAALWLMEVEANARYLGVTTPCGIELLRMCKPVPRVFTGYMPEPQRRNLRHRLYRDGLRTPKDGTARAMERMGLR